MWLDIVCRAAMSSDDGSSSDSEYESDGSVYDTSDSDDFVSSSSDSEAEEPMPSGGVDRHDPPVVPLSHFRFPGRERPDFGPFSRRYVWTNECSPRLTSAIDKLVLYTSTPYLPQHHLVQFHSAALARARVHVSKKHHLQADGTYCETVVFPLVDHGGFEHALHVNFEPGHGARERLPALRECVEHVWLSIWQVSCSLSSP